MARRLFGGTGGEVLLDGDTGQFVAGGQVTIWTTRISGTGTRVTDVLDAAGQAVDNGVLTADDAGGVQFWGPPSDPDELFIDTGRSVRWRATPVDVAARVKTLEATPPGGGAPLTPEALEAVGGVVVPDDAAADTVPVVKPDGSVQFLGAFRFPVPDENNVGWVFDAAGNKQGIQYVAQTDGPPDNTAPTPTHRWAPAPTTAPAAQFWPSAIPSGVAAVKFLYGQIGGETGPQPDAFGAGVDGYRLGNDNVGLEFGSTFEWTPDNDKHDLIVMRARDFIIDNVNPSVDATLHVMMPIGLHSSGQFDVYKLGIWLARRSGNWLWWIVDEAGSGQDLALVAAPQAPLGDNTGIAGPLTIALDINDAESAVIIEGGGAPRQTIPIDMSGHTGYHGLDFNGGSSGADRGYKTLKSLERYAGITVAQRDTVIAAAGA